MTPNDCDYTCVRCAERRCADTDPSPLEHANICADCITTNEHADMAQDEYEETAMRERREGWVA